MWDLDLKMNDRNVKQVLFEGGSQKEPESQKEEGEYGERTLYPCL
jgi:hypothetical protein